MEETAFDYVLFDLGGVLVQLSGVRSMGELAGIESDDEVWRRWLSCKWVREFERGWCSAEDFAAGVVHDWELKISPAEFLERFLAWPVGMFDGATALVDAVRAHVAVGCLSNTNELHWNHQRERWGLSDLFQVHFLSHELGLVKPDREVFEHVAGALDVPPRRLLFLDDNAINVEGASAAGLVASHTRGVDEARAALVEHSVLAP